MRTREPTEMEAGLAAKKHELDDAVLGAATDPSFVPLRDRLRSAVQRLEAEMDDLAAIDRASRAQAKQQSEAATRERRREAQRLAEACCGEIADLGGELDGAIDRLRALFVRCASVNNAMRKAVHSGANLSGAGLAEDLQYLSAYNDSELAKVLRELAPISYSATLHASTQRALREIPRYFPPDDE